MQWWAWLVIIVLVGALLVGGVLALQSRRRRGRVIVDPVRPPSQHGGGDRT